MKLIISKALQKLFQMLNIRNQHFSCFCSVETSHYSCVFQLVHDSPCTVVAQF